MTDEEAMRMARTNRRLRDALQPRDDFEEHDLQMLAQVVRVEVIERLAVMAERMRRPDLRVVS